jgi:hypothetical protein
MCCRSLVAGFSCRKVSPAPEVSVSARKSKSASDWKARSDFESASSLLGLLPEATKSERAVSIKRLSEESTLSSSEVEFRVPHLPNRKASVRTRPGSGLICPAGGFHRSFQRSKRERSRCRGPEKKATTGKGRDNTPNPRQTLGQPPADSLFSLLLWYLLSRLKMDSAATLPCRNENRLQAKPRYMGGWTCTSLGLKVDPVEHAGLTSRLRACSFRRSLAGWGWGWHGWHCAG